MNEDLVVQRKENAAKLNSELDKLEWGHYNLGQIDYKAFWTHVKEYNNLLYNTKPIDSTDWKELSERKQRIIESVKSKQNDEFYKRMKASKDKRENILIHLKEAIGWIREGKTQDHLSKAVSCINKAKSIIDEKGLIKDDAQECWTEYKSVNNELFYKRQELMKYKHYELKRTAWDLKSNLTTSNYKDTASSLKDLLNDLRHAYLDKFQRQEVWDIISKTFEEINVIRAQKKQEWEERQRERERKQREWEEKKAKWESYQAEKKRRQEEWEKRQSEWQERQAENERRHTEWLRKQAEYQSRQAEKERKHAEWLERQAERERKQEEWRRRHNKY